MKLLKALEKKEKKILVLSHSEKIYQDCMETASFITKNDKICLYITLNKPATAIKKEIKKRKLNPKKFYFIDGISQSVTEPKEEKNILYVPNPSHLMSIANAIQELTSIVGDEGVVLIDALRTLSIYNNPTEVSDFLSFLIKKTKDSGPSLITFTTRADKNSIKEYSSFFDSVIQAD